SGTVAVAPGDAGAGGVRLHPAQPNPFTSRTTLRFDLAQAEHVQLDVIDVAGRRVRQLMERPLLVPGAYTIAWDGAADDGRTAPAGIYFVRLAPARGTHATRLARVP